jgi:hypothetical protein
MLFGAIVLGFYEVIYKLALPEGHGGVGSEKTDVEDIASVHQPISNEDTTLLSPTLRRSVSEDSSAVSLNGYPFASPLDSGTTSDVASGASTKLPLALHANMLTSMIGVMTLCLFWIPIPILHWLEWEPFALPWGNWGLLIVVCLTGAIYVSNDWLICYRSIVLSRYNLLRTPGSWSGYENVFGKRLA